MGTASIVLGIIGICISWLPVAGWVGVAFGVLACLFGVPSVTRWYGKPGYGPWGVSGIILGLLAFILSLSYQIKHADGALDGLVIPLQGPLPIAIFALSSAFVATGLVLSRKKRNYLVTGELLALIGLMAIGLCGAWALTTADRNFDQTNGVHSADQ